MSDILTKSPYLIESTAGTTAQIDVWIGEGLTTGSTPTYTMQSTVLNGSAVFDIAPIIDDYFTGSFDGSYSPGQTLDVLWRETTILGDVFTSGSGIPLKAYEGYGYFNEGSNPDLQGKEILLSTSLIYTVEGENVNIPVKGTTGIATVFNSDSTVLFSPYYTEYIEYFTTASLPQGEIGAKTVSNTFNTFNDRVIGSGSTVEAKGCIGGLCLLSEGTGSADYYTVKHIPCSIQTPTRVTFLNKNGAYEDIWFQGTSKERLNTKEETFRARIGTGNTYDTNVHQYQSLRKTGRQSVTLVSGYYPQAYNEAFEQLMVSGKVWVHYEGNIAPALIKTSDLAIKTSLVDKLISYTIEFELAYDKINNVR